MPKKHAGGRPRHGEDAKRIALNTRTTPALRAKIEDAADRNGWSLTQEIEYRLNTSFIDEERAGGRHVQSFCRMLGATMAAIEERRGARWIDDVATWEAVEAAARRLLFWERPEAPEDQAKRDLRRRLFKASPERINAAAQLDSFRNALGMDSSNGISMAGLTRGLFGWEDPRASWTDDQREEEARLVAAWQAASDETNAILAEMDEAGTPAEERREAAAAEGAEEARAWHKLLGPRPGSAVAADMAANSPPLLAR